MNAEALGQMGSNAGGSGGSMLGDIAGLGVTLGAAAVATVTGGWACACGAKNIQSKFCGECGCKKP